MLSITLNSFVHRVGDKSAVLALACQLNCQLKRIRRSRHWQLTGEEDALRTLMTLLDSEANLWIIKAIEKHLPAPSITPEQLLENNPTMSVSQLVSESGCSLAQAREAIDKFEGF
ncbi:hypothetical protein NM09_15155 [Vibrio caribbeanicus]|uniref:Uncharacterized protein n=1 Tax=Vibrio caribbeanicus TaxID=701175 RepID=A0ACC4NTN7_9VIBR|nr:MULTISPECIES: ribosome recycling factor family protein [Vibrio]KHD23847.1 hypothetical protein NM09_15155 [Vibrio caribbeanicus]KHT49448.1 hypothetical protein RJ46_07770 [Vibrio sinaloensis]